MTEPQTTSPNPQASFESWREGRVMQGGVPRHDLKGSTGTPMCCSAPCVTAPASAAAFPPTMQVPRRTPLSLSLRSLAPRASEMNR